MCARVCSEKHQHQQQLCKIGQTGFLPRDEGYAFRFRYGQYEAQNLRGVKYGCLQFTGGAFLKMFCNVLELGGINKNIKTQVNE